MAEDYYTINVSPLFIPWSNINLGKFRLNSFQAQVGKLLSARKDLLVYAPTGAGKTLTVLLSPWFSELQEDMPGFVSIYPNNTLLENQMSTLGEIVREALDGRIIETEPKCSPGNAEGEDCKPSYIVYEIEGSRSNGRGSIEVENKKYIIMIALSGRYIQSENGIPKREILYDIAERVYRYDRKGGVYLVVFATPDTFLLVFTGAYRNFKLVGAALHNILLAIASQASPQELENILRRARVSPRSQLSDVISVKKRLLYHPLFIDEFHLYGPYEVDALYAILNLFKEETGLPVVFSSATPAEDILRELEGTGVKPEVIRSETSKSEGFPVRGPMSIKIVPVNVPVKSKSRGLIAYYKVGDEIPRYISENLLEELKQLEGRALIILDRLWMVTEVARVLRSHGIPVECIASIFDEEICVKNAPVIVGSEATTQGVNLGRVTLGVMGGVSSEDVIQRIGRVGRKGVASKVYLFIPSFKLDEARPPDEADYYGLVEWVSKAYPNYSKRKRDVSNLLPEEFHRVRRRLIYSLAVASEARVAGNIDMLRKINLTSKEALELLESVVGDPESLTKLIVFRRTGFTVRYVVEDSGQKGENTIGLITRNFLVKKVLGDGTLVISFKPSRSTLVMHIPRVSPGYFRGRFTPLKLLLERLGGEIILRDNEKDVKLDSVNADTLVYVGSLGAELSEYLSYTGEGAKIVSELEGVGEYAVVFV